MDPMTKMYVSFVAIGLMFACNYLMVKSRKIANSFFSITMKIAAFLMLIVTFFLIVVVLMF